ncbi:MAG: gephyrin-like molybdotransferase Glp [Crocinitomicaceae bacterium]
MISVAEAIKLLNENSPRMSEAKVGLSDALGCVVSEDVLSPVTFPPFDQSAMDGYAVNGRDIHEFELVGEIKAGDDASKISLSRGQAVRIFTGAMVPSTADAVIKQEDIHREIDRIALNVDREIKELENIRPEGEQIQKGETVISKGTKVNNGVVSYCAMLGIESLMVYKKPSICIVTTGSELVAPGIDLKPGQIYDSNSVMLSSSLKELGFNSEIFSTSDDLDKTKSVISKAIANYDLVLITGGISVGDYDFVQEALNENGVSKVFYKVKQKPGKPLYMGVKGNTVVFGLPGNPASVHSCYHVYVLPTIRYMLGLPGTESRETRLLKGRISKAAGRTQFMKAIQTNDTVEVLKRQSSAMLGDLVEANCLLVFPEEKESLENERVEIIHLPQPHLF